MERRLFLQLLPATASAMFGNCDVPHGDCMERIAGWACDLNHYDWPNDWGQPPDWIIEKFSHGKGSRACYECHKDRYSTIMDGLNAICGPREVLRAHNVVRRKHMTEAEFDDFWRGVYENDEAARKRYDARYEVMS